MLFRGAGTEKSCREADRLYVGARFQGSQELRSPVKINHEPQLPALVSFVFRDNRANINIYFTSSWYAATCFHKISQYFRLKYILSPILAASCCTSAPSLRFSSATSLLQTGVRTLLNFRLRDALVVIQIAFGGLSLFFLLTFKSA